MRLFRDRLGEASKDASYERRVNRMTPPQVTSRHHPKAKPAAAPHPCPNGCGATVRAGVCPSPDC